MRKVRDVIPEDKITFEAYQCGSCGEELMGMLQLKQLAAKYRELRKARDITFAKWGNSIAVRIPNELVGAFGIKEGKQGLIKKEREGIKIIPV
jgi:hypothetical protein